jgi:predicted ATPase
MHKRINLPISLFADRDDESSTLKDIIMDTQSGEHIMLVRGNIGVGKTRLVQEVLKPIDWRDIIWGECSYLADYVAYYVVRELVKSQLQVQGSDILKEIKSSYKHIVGKLIPEALGESAGQAKDTHVHEDKFAFYEGIRQIVDKGTRAKVIVIDNSQWIDQASTNLLRFLIKAEKRHGTSFVFIYRTDEKTEVLKTFLDTLRKHH